MRTISYSNQFKRDVEKAEKRKKDLSKLKNIIQLLINDESLPVKLKDHPLISNWKGYRDLHIEPD